nr:L-serine ammonia-lyase [Bacteroidota bacterium]
MDSIVKIFKIGYGPSSSHTMAPRKAASAFKERYPKAKLFRVTLYGSLAATGKGHLTDLAIMEEMSPVAVEIIWEAGIVHGFHPNAMKFEAFDDHAVLLGDWTVYSVGGGEITDGDMTNLNEKNIYPYSTMKQILAWCDENGKQFWEHVGDFEDDSVWIHLAEVWEVMKQAIRRGLENEGVLPGSIKLPRKASAYMMKANGFKGSLKRRSQVFAYALAVAEENAGGGKVVTAPTCGSSGVLPAVLFMLHRAYKFPDQKIIRALATAGLIGNIVKQNASISGAEVGCQGEIGTACAMAAAAASQLFGATPAQIEYAAEMGLEHHLGLTCDPIAGLVQIPCIERNAFAASRALDANIYAVMSDGKHRVSFDKVVFTMNQTGKDLPSLYRETAGGGLALESGL